MLPLPSHMVRSIWQAESSQTAQQVHMANGIQFRDRRLIPALISRFIPSTRKEAASYEATCANTPC